MNTQIQITILEKQNVLLAPVIALQNPESETSKEGEWRVHLKEGERFVTRTVTVGLSDFKQAEVVLGLKEKDVLGVVMTSRLKKANERLEKRIKRSRSFGGGKKK